MAEKITITQVVDLILTSGSVDFKELEKKFPKLIEQGLAKLPGAKAVVSPHVTVDPKFDMAKAASKLREALNSKQGTADFERLEKGVTKYATALEHLSKITTTGKFSAPFLKKVDQYAAGTLDPKLDTKVFRSRLDSYRNYLAELQSVFKQIKQPISSIRDSAPNVELVNAQKRLADAKRATAKDTKALQAAILSDAPESVRAPLIRRLDNHQNKVQLEKDNVAALRNAGATGSRKVGAHIDPELLAFDRAIGGMVKKLDSADKVSAAKKARQEREEAKKDQAELDKAKERAITNYQAKRRGDALEAKKEQAELDKAKEKAITNYQAKRRSDALEAKKEQVELDKAKERAIVNYQAKKRGDLIEAKKEREALQQERIATERLIEAQQILRGRVAYRAAGGNLQHVPEESHADVNAMLKSRMGIAQRRLERVTRLTGIDSPETQAAARAVHGLGAELNQLGQIATHTHPIMDRVGRVIGQFAKYALGYGALYKVTQAFNAVTASVINLEDKLKSIQAITGSSTAEMSQMAATIKQVAVTSAFGIGDIADAVRIIAQAGTELKDIPKTVQASSDLASASGTNLQTAADIITTAKSVWEDIGVTEIADRVTQAANVSKLAVEDLQTIFSLGASFAKSANLNLDQYLGLVATLKNSGVRASTIATGTSQFLTEVTAPDEKFSAFLSKRYKAIGEDVSSKEARKKFSSFRYEDNPILAALNELKRIGADSAAALPGLERSIDKRAFRVLQPLLDDLGKLQETSGRLLTAPSAQESSRIAMDSLKKASANLADQFEVLASTLTKDAIPSMTKLVKSTAEAVHRVDDLVNRASLNRPSDTSDWKSIAAGTIAGGWAGVSRGRGAWKFLTGAVGAVGGATGILAANTASDINGNSETTTKIIDAGLTAYMLSKVTHLANLFKAVNPATAAVTGAAVASQKTIGASIIGWLAKLTTGITAKLAGIGITAAGGVIVSNFVAAALVAWTTLQGLVAVADLFKSDARKLADLQKQKQRGMDPAQLRDLQAKEKAEASQSELTRFAQGSNGAPPPKDSIAGKVAKQVQALDRLRQDYGYAIGAPDIGPENDALLAQKLHELGSYPTQGAKRTEKLKSDQQLFGGTGQIDAEAVQAAKDASAEIESAIKGLVDETAKRYGELINSQNLSDVDEKELQLLKNMQQGSGKTAAVLRGIIGGNTAAYTNRDLLNTLSEFSRNAAQTIGTPVDKVELDLRHAVDAFAAISKQREPDNKAVATADMQNAIRMGVEAHGITFGKEIIAAATPSARLGDLSDKQLLMGIDELINRLIKVESGGNPNAVSSAGAKGIVQLMPSHWDQVKGAGYGTGILPLNSTPEQEIEHAKQYLFGMARAYPDWTQEKLLSAYNGGPGNEAAAGDKVLNPDYANKIKGNILVQPFSERDFGPRAAALDTLAESILRAYEKDAHALRKIQDAATVQTQALAKTREGTEAVNITTQSGKVVRDTPLNIAKVLQDSTLEIAKGLTEGGGGRYDKVKDLLKITDPVAKFKAYEQLAPELEDNKIADLIKRGALVRNPETKLLEANNRVTRLTDKQLQQADEEKEKTLYQPNLETAHKIFLLQEEINRLEVEDRPQLRQRDLYGQVNALQRQELAAERVHIANNSYTSREEEQGTREQALRENEIKGLELDFQMAQKNEKLKYTIEKDLLSSKKQMLDTQIETLRSNQSSMAAAGKLAEYDSDLNNLVAERKTIQSKLLELEKARGEATPGQIAAINNQETLNNLSAQFNAQNIDVQTRAENISSGFQFFGPEGHARNAYRQAVGQELPTLQQAAFAQSQVAGFTKLQAERQQTVDEIKRVLGSLSEGSVEFGKFNEQLQVAQSSLIDISVALAEAQARVDMYNPTLASELGQVSGASIGAKIDDLPGSMKNLSSNLENRVVAAVQGFTDAMYSSLQHWTKGLLGLNQPIASVKESLIALRNAQADYQQQVMAGSLDTAAAITDIRNNENDPARQEYLIKRALDAQAAAEQIAKQQADYAKRNYDIEVRNNGQAGQFRQAGADLIGGVSKDLFSASVGGFFSNLFSSAEGGGFFSDLLGKTGLGRPAGTYTSPLWVQIKGLFGGSSGGAGSGGVSNSMLGGLTSGLQSGLQGLFGGGDNTGFSGIGPLTAFQNGAEFNGTGPLLAFANDGGAASGGFWSGLGDMAGAAWDGLGGVLSSAGTGIMDGLSSFFSMIPMFFSGGGAVKGPGTSVSDSVHAALSNGEYVLNAHTTRRIGKDVLDKWNFHHQTPVKLATGGLVGQMAAIKDAVNSRKESPAGVQSGDTAGSASGNPSSMRVVLVDDHRKVADFINSPAGEKTMVEFVRRNSLSLRNVLGS